MPLQQPDWKAVADEFEECWNFPNCIGAIDGKYIAIKHPINSGLYFFITREPSVQYY